MAIFGPKAWVNPFGKMSIFGLFELLVFIVYKGVLGVLEYRKRYFPCLYCLKKKNWKNGHFWNKPWVNLFGKMVFSGLILPIKKSWEIALFGPKPWFNPFGNVSIYAPCSLANKPYAVQCAFLGVSSVCLENWKDFIICRNFATQLSGRLLIIRNQITQKPEIKTSSQQRWGQTRQSPDRPLETGPPHPKPKQCTVPEQEIL